MDLERANMLVKVTNKASWKYFCYTSNNNICIYLLLSLNTFVYITGQVYPEKDTYNNLKSQFQ